MLTPHRPSHVSPFVGAGAAPYRILQGTTFAQYGPELAFVEPLLLPARTDTRNYAQVSEHVFRFSPVGEVTDDTDGMDGNHGAHRVNERVNMVGHVNAVQWYSLFIRNMDRAPID